MMRPIVNEMAALTQASQVFQPIVAWIVIEVGGGQDYARLPHPGCFLDIGPTGGATAAVAPGLTSGIEPASVRQNADDLAMRSATALANAAGTLEAHMPAELRPVDGIERFPPVWAALP